MLDKAMVKRIGRPAYVYTNTENFSVFSKNNSIRKATEFNWFRQQVLLMSQLSTPTGSLKKSAPRLYKNTPKS